MASRVAKPATVITAHAWSPDRKQLALCPNTEDVLIYSGVENEDASTWKLEHTLKGHDILVTSIDWSATHNKIVTCAHDRNAFVWTLMGNEWKPSLSILRINRAALDCKWSPDGKKFAVASGARCVPVCSYEQQNDWWISRIIKKSIKSSVLGVAWHPSSHLVATASSDFRARIYSAYIPEVDGSGVKTIICGDTASTGFGDLLAEFAGSNGWVESVSFSFNGLALAYVGHDATLNICTWDEKNPTAEPNQETLKEPVLPSTKVLWLSDQIIVTAGHDFRPFVYQHPGPNRGSWKLLGSLEKEPDAKKDAPAAGSGDQTGFSASKALWSNRTVKAQDTTSSQQDSAELWTKHANTIIDMKLMGDTVYSTKVDTFSTAGLDGRIVVWKAKGAVPNIAL